MGVESQVTPGIDFSVQPLRPAELSTCSQPGLSWLWYGFLAPGKVTALIGPPKSSGKTTLLSVLLARFAEGGQLAGLPVKPARVFVISEESAADWDARCRRLGIGPHVQFLCRPFPSARPTEQQWFALIASLEALQHRTSLDRAGLDLVVIDALATLLPGYAETCAPKLLDLLPLQALANLGPAVCLVHHPAKGRRPADGESSRGTIALPGFADIVMEMSCCRRARSRDRRRRICGFSRYSETPRHLMIELSADGSDYLAASDPAGTPLVRTWPEVHAVPAEARDRLNQEEILERWPAADKDPPERSTLFRWLTRATQQGLICRQGNGHRGDRYRYWLPGYEPLLWPGNCASFEEQEAWRRRCREYSQGLWKLPESA